MGVDLHRMLFQHIELFSSKDTVELSKELVFEETVSRLNELKESGKTNMFLSLFSNIFEVRKENNERSNLITQHLLDHRPNDSHKFFDWHIKNGGKHITVNIDQFIESVSGIRPFTKQSVAESQYKIISCPSEGYILKIHGDTNKDEWKTQGYTIENINKFNDQFAAFLDEQINSVKFVVFIGYGGVDKYDITPYFDSKQNGSFKGKKALWIQYGGTDDLKEPENIKLSIDTILSKFQKHIIVETTCPEKILNSLFNRSDKIRNSKIDQCSNGKDVENYIKDVLVTNSL